MFAAMAASTERLKISRVESQRIPQSSERHDVITVGRDRDMTLSQAIATEDILGLLYEPQTQALIAFIVAALGS
jgi:hypothetical protein